MISSAIDRDLNLKSRVVGRVPTVEMTVGSHNLSYGIESTAQDIDDADNLQLFEPFRPGESTHVPYCIAFPKDAAADRAAGPPHFGSGVTLPFRIVDRIGFDGVPHAATIALLPL